MENYVQADDYELWMIIKNVPLIPKKAIEDGNMVPKEPQEFNAEDFKMMERMQRPKNSCILALVLMSTLAFLSSIQQRDLGCPPSSS